MWPRYCVRTIFAGKNVKKVFKRKLTNNITSAYIVNAGLPDVPIPSVTLPEFLEKFFIKYEKLTAIECSESKRKYTYGEIRTKSTNLSKALKKILKLNSGDVVAIVLTNVPEYPIANLGILKANLITTTVSPVYTPDEISNQLVSSCAKAVITEVNLVSTVKKALEISSKKIGNIPVLTVKTKDDQGLPENTINFHELVSTKFDYPDIQPCNPEEVAVLPFSSGTTGLPKGVELTHQNLVSNLIQDSHPDMCFKKNATENFQEVLPTVLPFYHAFGFNVVMTSITLHGGKLITIPKFKPDSYISMLKNYQESTVLYLVPPIVLLLTSHPSVKKEYLRNVRVIMTGAAPLAASDEKRFSRKFGDNITFLQGYGLTETSPVAASLWPPLMEKEESYRGSIGRPIVNTLMKIVDINDPKNTPLGPNISGELLIKGPQVMKGYYKLPEETKHVLTEDGWLRTGDVSHYNEDGFFFISDRFKELIKVKGNQVPPAELEAVIRSFPPVADAAVIGIPHETSGEIPRAYVVPKIGEKVDIEALDQFVNEKVAKYKRLKGGIVVLEEIPKNASGKILRRQLREEFLKTGL